MDIQIKSQPFTKNELRRIKEDLSIGRLCRFGAIVNHQKLNFSHNALIAWARKSLDDGLSRKLKEKDYISHIYLRKEHPLWPFGLYTMIHSQTKKELDAYIGELSKLLGDCRFKILRTIREFKKTSFNPYI